MALAGLIGAPFIWLSALQTGYTLAYQACDSQSRYWVTVPTAVALAGVIVTLAITFHGTRRARQSFEPQPFLAWLGFGLAALMTVVLIASLIAPLLLRPCD